MANCEKTRSDAVAPFSPEPEDVAVVSAPSSTWRPPRNVGEYSITGFLGFGGMGQVYRAWDDRLQRHVAVKFILGIEPDATARERFMIEARATARIRHPNVVSIHGVHEFEGHPYLVMEYLSGPTLAQIAKPVRWSRALELGVQLAGGLAAAHRQSVLHRDIKPDNAKLADEDERLVKLLDFGLAKLATHRSTPSAPPASEAAATLRTRGSADERTTLTDAGLGVGTPGYRAPECWGGSATARSDVYSLGALLFELCAGHAPHANVAPQSLSFAVRERDAPLLTAIDPTFAAIIARCLSRDPNARYASGEELYEALKDLERAVSSGPLPSVATRAARTMVFREIGALVVSVLSPEAPTDEDWNAYLQLCRAKKARESIRVLVVSAGGGPTPPQRLAIRELLAEGPVPTAVVTDAPTAFDISKFMSWTNPEIRTFKPESLDDALRYLSVDGPMADRVRVEVGAMQRELA